MVIVKSKRALRHQSLKLLPGKNKVDPEVWKRVSGSIPSPWWQWIETDAAPAADPSPPPPTPTPEPQPEPESPAPPDDDATRTEDTYCPSLAMKASDAARCINEIDDLVELDRFIDGDGRKTVVAAAIKRIAYLRGE